MILKKNFNPLAVAQYMRQELIFSLSVSLMVYAAWAMGWLQLAIPFSVAGILGSALAIFIAFRNNSSYQRWWEARSFWGGIVNSSRVLARLVVTFTDSHRHQPNFDESRSQAFKTEVIHLLIAWSHALRIGLRGGSWEPLAKYLPDHELAALKASVNKPNHIQLLMGRKIYEAMANGTLGGFDSFQMEGQLLALANYQGGSERIKTTPLLRQYHYFTRLFLFTFMAMLPLSLMADLARQNMGFLLVPVSVLISFVFGVMAKVGEVNENPFEGQITDVPLTALCNEMERDVLYILGETKLPEPETEQQGFLM